MKSNRLVLGALIMFSTGVLFAQGCPPKGDKNAALQFLQANRSHGPDIDPGCVDQAFGTLNYDKSFIKPLIQLLDFERSIEHHISTIMPGTQYPAITSLGRTMGKAPVPDLIGVIKENDNDLFRTNATWALDEIFLDDCRGKVIDLLEIEVKKQSTTSEQRERLRAAEALVLIIHRGCDA